MVSSVDVGLGFTPLKSGGAAVSALRAFRLLRVFKIAKSWKKLHDMIKTISYTLKDISNFTVLLFLFIFVFSLLGMELFAHKVMFDSDSQLDLENGDPPLSHFNSF